MRFPLERLKSFVVELFVSLDVLPSHAETTADRLLEADLRGRGGHGLIRVPQYATRIEAGGVNLRPEIRLLRETPVSALVDGDNGLGQVVMTRATDVAIDKATRGGLAWVGTTRSNHAGAAGVYPALALDHDLIALYTAVGSANVMPPWGGRDRVLGTNPIAIAIPAGEQNPFQLDIATTVASHGSIKVALQAGEEIPEGWVVDLDGNPVIDPSKADDGYLMPIGGYKGSGLNMALGLLAGVINGAAFGADVIDFRTVPDQPTNTGQAILVMRPDLFRDADEVRADMDAQLVSMREAGVPGAVRIPGDSAILMEATQRREGVEVSPTVLDQLRDLGSRLRLSDNLEG